MFSAWLAGMVHGVVVQITACALPAGSSARPNAAARRPRSRSLIGKPTSTAGLPLSWYSTSASASADPQSKHQFTGFRPRYTQPFFTISASARISPASLPKSIVR